MKFYKIIAFCSNPVIGQLKFRNIFQIYPLADQGAPQNSIIKSYPFVLEFCLTDQGEIELDSELKSVSKIISNLTGQVNFQNKILKLLTAFSNFNFYIPKIDPQWFARVDGMTEQELNNQTSVAGLNIYQFPQWKENFPIHSFTQIKYKEIEPKKHPECFQYIDIDGKEPVTFSQYIVGAFHNYFLLSDIQMAAVDSAAELITQGITLSDSMKSLSFIALISSIETMVAFEYRDLKIEKCKTCGVDQYKVMSKFRDYLFDYATGETDTKKPINELYNLRSKIAHTGMLLFGDGKIDWSTGDNQDEQLNMHLQAMMLSRLSLMNWILKRGEKEKTKS